MSVTTTGTPYENANFDWNGGSFSRTDVTIPSGATTAFIGFGWYHTSTVSISAVTLDGQSATQVLNEDNGSGTNSGAVWRVSGFSSGASKTLAATIGGTNYGPDISIVFVSGEDTSTPVSSSVASSTSDTGLTATSGALTAATGDLFLSFFTADNSYTTTYGSGQTEIAGPVSGGNAVELTVSSEAATNGDTQTGTGDYITGLFLVVAQATGGALTASGTPSSDIITASGVASFRHSASGTPSSDIITASGTAGILSSVTITDVNTTESWDDGDTGLVITGTGFV